MPSTASQQDNQQDMVAKTTGLHDHELLEDGFGTHAIAQVSVKIAYLNEMEMACHKTARFPLLCRALDLYSLTISSVCHRLACRSGACSHSSEFR